MSAEVTRERILNAAESLFAEHGFSATSVRAITALAGVNLAALNYHFGSKDGVIDAVFSRRITPLNRERIRLLDRVENRGDGKSAELEELLSAFLGPVIRLAAESGTGGERFMRLMGRAHYETSDFFEKFISKQFHEVVLRYETAFIRVLPDIPLDEFFWRFLFVIGAMAHTMSHSMTPSLIRVLRHLGSRTAKANSIDLGDPANADRVLSYLVNFAAAGLKAECRNGGVAKSEEFNQL